VLPISCAPEHGIEAKTCPRALANVTEWHFCDRAPGRSCWDAVAELYDAIVESVLVEKLEVGADACG
jgi:hypothetical protein